jgi:hypothetical protein
MSLMTDFGGSVMKTVYKQYGVTASITDKRDGTARLVVRDAFSKKVWDSIHTNRKAALAAWYRMCR